MRTFMWDHLAIYDYEKWTLFNGDETIRQKQAFSIGIISVTGKNFHKKFQSENSSETFHVNFQRRGEFNYRREVVFSNSRIDRILKVNRTSQKPTDGICPQFLVKTGSPGFDKVALSLSSICLEMESLVNENEFIRIIHSYGEGEGNTGPPEQQVRFTHLQLNMNFFFFGRISINVYSVYTKNLIFHGGTLFTWRWFNL